MNAKQRKIKAIEESLIDKINELLDLSKVQRTPWNRVQVASALQDIKCEELAFIKLFTCRLPKKKIKKKARR